MPTSSQPNAKMNLRMSKPGKWSSTSPFSTWIAMHGEDGIGDNIATNGGEDGAGMVMVL